MAKVAGGNSIAEDILPAPVGELSLEHVLTNKIDFYIGTAIGSLAEGKNKRFSHIALGPQVDELNAKRSLAELMNDRPLVNLKSLNIDKAHALWHHFYNSPLNLYAIQVMAKWFHPQLFSELQPEQTLEYLLKGFSPVDLKGQYAITISEI
jgi:iron complex transport system substrate-binding protein